MRYSSPKDNADLIQAEAEAVIDFIATRQVPTTIRVVGVAYAMQGLAENLPFLKQEGFTAEQVANARQIVLDRLRETVAALEVQK